MHTHDAAERNGKGNALSVLYTGKFFLKHGKRGSNHILADDGQKNRLVALGDPKKTAHGVIGSTAAVDRRLEIDLIRFQHIKVEVRLASVHNGNKDL